MSIVTQRLRIVPEFQPDDHEMVRSTLAGKLDRRLSRWDAEQVELEISVKGRDSDQQRVALECWLAGAPKMVATSSERRLEDAVAEVRDDLHRQVDKFLTKREAARNR